MGGGNINTNRSHWNVNSNFPFPPSSSPSLQHQFTFFFFFNWTSWRKSFFDGTVGKVVISICLWQAWTYILKWAQSAIRTPPFCPHQCKPDSVVSDQAKTVVHPWHVGGKDGYPLALTRCVWPNRHMPLSRGVFCRCSLLKCGFCNAKGWVVADAAYALLTKMIA